MNKYLIGAILIFLSGCSYIGWDESRISVNFSAKQFNSVASQYISRPTFATLTTFKNGSEKLVISMDPYGDPNRDIPFSSGYFDIEFVREHVNDYVSSIDKYLKWEKQASQDGDIFTKEIAEVEGYATDILFKFHSGNSASHYLVLSHSGSSEQYYDKFNAERLREFLINYKNGAISQKNYDKKYK